MRELIRSRIERRRGNEAAQTRNRADDRKRWWPRITSDFWHDCAMECLLSMLWDEHPDLPNLEISRLEIAWSTGRLSCSAHCSVRERICASHGKRKRLTDCHASMGALPQLSRIPLRSSPITFLWPLEPSLRVSPSLSPPRFLLSDRPTQLSLSIIVCDLDRALCSLLNHHRSAALRRILPTRNASFFGPTRPCATNQHFSDSP